MYGITKMHVLESSTKNKYFAMTSFILRLFLLFVRALYFTAMAGTFLMLFVEIEKGYLERTLVAGTVTLEQLSRTRKKTLITV